MGPLAHFIPPEALRESKNTAGNSLYDIMIIKRLGLKIAADGVEKNRQLDALSNL